MMRNDILIYETPSGKRGECGPMGPAPFEDWTICHVCEAVFVKTLTYRRAPRNRPSCSRCEHTVVLFLEARHEREAVVEFLRALAEKAEYPADACLYNAADRIEAGEHTEAP